MTVETIQPTGTQKEVVVKEMSWDPITRIVGSLGIHAEIDFTNRQVKKAYSTSMVFRGFDIFMRGIDPRDAHFITSRICGICGDNHCTWVYCDHGVAAAPSAVSRGRTTTGSWDRLPR
jgi:hydrogenase large subunit